MAYDEGLAQRIREQLDRPAVVEKAMFGGLAFLLRGNMCVGVIGDDMIVRLDPAEYDRALKRAGARVFDFTGRPMKGWLVVDGPTIEDDAALAGWIDVATRFVAFLPPKTGGAAPPKPPPKSRRKK